jgi:hypothetical protein
MLPTRRPFHPTIFAGGILGKFPAWMGLQNPSSTGYRFIDAIAGNELELFNSTLEIYKSYTSIVKSPIDALEKLSSIEVPYYIKDHIIYDSLNTPIYVVENSHEFLTNPPTRLQCLDQMVIRPSGLSGYDITGLEWMEGTPSGLLAIKIASDDILPSSLLYYPITSKNNNVAEYPVSGVTLGLGFVGLGKNNDIDKGIIESEWSLRKKYPDGVWITASGDVETTTPSGINWVYQSYVDMETGQKIYRKKLFNNPYGSGVYNQSDVQLSYTPLSGTIVVKDVFNLLSGVPAEIPSSGLNFYTFTSGHIDPKDGLFKLDAWNYKGYESLIPWNELPKSIQDERTLAQQSGQPLPADLAGIVSWRLLPSGGYIDDEVFPHSGTFNWIDGVSGYTNIIRFTNAFSKYTIEYNYRVYDTITQISADPKDAYRPASPSGGDVYFITSAQNIQPIKIETSLVNANAIRIDPYDVRPGTTLFYTQTKDTWLNARTDDKTVQFYKHNIGYTDNLGLRNG